MAVHRFWSQDVSHPGLPTHVGDLWLYILCLAEAISNILKILIIQQPVILDEEKLYWTRHS